MVATAHMSAAAIDTYLVDAMDLRECKHGQSAVQAWAVCHVYDTVRIVCEEGGASGLMPERQRLALPQVHGVDQIRVDGCTAHVCCSDHSHLPVDLSSGSTMLILK